MKAKDRLALWQASIMGGAYASERHRRATSEETLQADQDRERRRLKRSKLPARPKLEPAYHMAPIKKPKGFKREFESLIERTNRAADAERGRSETQG